LNQQLELAAVQLVSGQQHLGLAVLLQLEALSELAAACVLIDARWSISRFHRSSQITKKAQPRRKQR
jgi:hypothetical protein